MRTHIALALLTLSTVASGSAFADGGAISGRVDAMPAKFLGETVVYLKQAPAQKAPRTEVMDQKGMQFLPHVLVVTVGDTVKFDNHDAIFHNVFSKDNGGYYVGTFGPSQEGTHTFTKPGVYAQLCSIHPEMLGYIFVAENPDAAAVGKDGHFTIANVPPGTYEVEIWNSHLHADAQKVTVVAGKTAELAFSLHR